MKLHDPTRQAIGNRPKYSLGVFPDIRIFPLDDDKVEVRAILARAWNTFSDSFRVVTYEELPGILLSYNEDPEDFFLSFFKYTPPKITTIGKQSFVSLSDLGLLDDTPQVSKKAKTTISLEDLGL